MLTLLPLTLFGFLLGSTLGVRGPATNSSDTTTSGKDDCAVSDVVVKQGSNEPLKSARVQLRRPLLSAGRNRYIPAGRNWVV
jgi:hypothetical protein